MKITRTQLRRIIKEEISLLSKQESTTNDKKAPKIKSVEVPPEPNSHKFVVTLADGTVVPSLDTGITWQVPEGNSHPSKWTSSAARLSVKVDDTWYKYTKDNPDGVVDSERMD